MADLLTPDMADELIDESRSRGLWMDDRKEEYGIAAGTLGQPGIVYSPMPQSELIPRSEWDERIAKKDREQSWLEDLVRNANVPCLDQNGTNYCHGFSVAQCMQDERCKQGHPYVELSGMSIAGPVTGWRNKGAWPENDLMRAVEVGACPASYQDKSHSFNYKRWKRGWEKAAEEYQVDEWTDGLIPGKAFDAVATFALRSTPAATGHRWWSHAITSAYRLRKESNGRYSILSRNNWGMDWKDDGFTWMPEGTRKGGGTPDITLFGIRSMGATG